MIWPRRFMAVPTSTLRVDDSITTESPKAYTQSDLQEIAATVPAIYERIRDGRTPREFLDMRTSPDLNERALGETYAQLFRSTPSSNPLAATLDGNNLVVDKGNHRIRAAQALGVPVLPVWVSAASETQLDRVEGACNHLIEREGATADRDAHAAHETVPGHERGPSREGLRSEQLAREPKLPERER
jgi:hypothetical protein